MSPNSSVAQQHHSFTDLASRIFPLQLLIIYSMKMADRGWSGNSCDVQYKAQTNHNLVR